MLQRRTSKRRGSTRHCSNCGGADHNIRTCTARGGDRHGGTHTQPSDDSISSSSSGSDDGSSSAHSFATGKDSAGSGSSHSDGDPVIVAVFCENLEECFVAFGQDPASDHPDLLQGQICKTFADDEAPRAIVFAANGTSGFDAATCLENGEVHNAVERAVALVDAGVHAASDRRQLQRRLASVRRRCRRLPGMRSEASTLQGSGVEDMTRQFVSMGATNPSRDRGSGGGARSSRANAEGRRALPFDDGGRYARHGRSQYSDGDDGSSARHHAHRRSGHRYQESQRGDSRHHAARSDTHSGRLSHRRGSGRDHGAARAARHHHDEGALHRPASHLLEREHSAHRRRIRERGPLELLPSAAVPGPRQRPQSPAHSHIGFDLNSAAVSAAATAGAGQLAALLDRSNLPHDRRNAHGSAHSSSALMQAILGAPAASHVAVRLGREVGAAGKHTALYPQAQLIAALASYEISALALPLGAYAKPQDDAGATPNKIEIRASAAASPTGSGATASATKTVVQTCAIDSTQTLMRAVYTHGALFAVLSPPLVPHVEAVVRHTATVLPSLPLKSEGAHAAWSAELLSALLASWAHNVNAVACYLRSGDADDLHGFTPGLFDTNSDAHRQCRERAHAAVSHGAPPATPGGTPWGATNAKLWEGANSILNTRGSKGRCVKFHLYGAVTDHKLGCPHSASVCTYSHGKIPAKEAKELKDLLASE